tara:strand:+ start:7760 stop:8695 length:936 start_codon:yes stop_codon:yes gene_type:complete
MNKWKFDSHIYSPSGNNELKTSHAQLPTPLQLTEHTFRFFYSSRDIQGRSRPFTVDYDMESRNVISVAQKPILELGDPGAFDDCGIMPSSFVRVGKDIYFYFIGWNQRKNISYQLAIGLAISKDGGSTFKKISPGPVLDRNIHDPIFCAAPCVLFNGELFIMWYISGTAWPEYHGKPEPVYLIKRATSHNGIQWQTDDNICIPYKFEGEALGRPWVIKYKDKFQMIYSSRGSDSYRFEHGQHYQLGCAVSKDGITWQRQDSDFVLKNSDSGWDSEMQEYSSVFAYQNSYYMLYNGNTFGKTGFGIARLMES